MASSRYGVQPFPYGRKGRGRTHGMGSSRNMASAFPPIGPGNRGFQIKWPVFEMGPKRFTAVEVRAGRHQSKWAAFAVGVQRFPHHGSERRGAPN